jgi:TPR repeat protein
MLDIGRFDEAERLFKLAAESGSTDAAHNYANYLRGRLSTNTPVNTTLALSYLNQAAQQGHVSACYQLSEVEEAC